jgi:hypothetical protein
VLLCYYEVFTIVISVILYYCNTTICLLVVVLQMRHTDTDTQTDGQTETQRHSLRQDYYQHCYQHYYHSYLLHY